MRTGCSFVRKPTVGDLVSLGKYWRFHPRYAGCVGHWLMAEGGGTTVYDIAGRSANGTLTNMSTSTGWTRGRFGPALDFDGVDDFVDAGNWVGVKGSRALSVSFWTFKQVNVAAVGVVAATGGSAANRAFVCLDSTDGGVDADKFFFLVGDGTTEDFITSNHRLPTNAWEHTVCTFLAGDHLRIYSNGILNVTGTPTISALNSNPTANMQFGRYSTTLEFNGLIDDVRMYNRALAPSEVSSLFSAPFLEFEWAWQQQRAQWREIERAGLPLLPQYRRHPLVRR